MSVGGQMGDLRLNLCGNACLYFWPNANKWFGHDYKIDESKFRNYAPTVKMVVKSVLHEYTHFLQNLRWYGHTLQKVGYQKHPQELEARVMEELYSNCWKDIKGNL